MPLNYDLHFGHTFFQAAIDNAVLAERHFKDYPAEAKRLFQVAIKDTQAAIKEIQEHPSWAGEFKGHIITMKEKIIQWEQRILEA